MLARFFPFCSFCLNVVCMGVLFIRQEKLPNQRVREIENSVRQLISEGYAVHRHLMPLQQALNSEDVVTVPNEVSLLAVTVVSV